MMQLRDPAEIIAMVTYNWKRRMQLKAWLMGRERKSRPSRWRFGCRPSARSCRAAASGCSKPVSETQMFKSLHWSSSAIKRSAQHFPRKQVCGSFITGYSLQIPLNESFPSQTFTFHVTCSSCRWITLMHRILNIKIIDPACFSCLELIPAVTGRAAEGQRRDHSHSHLQPIQNLTGMSLGCGVKQGYLERTPTQQRRVEGHAPPKRIFLVFSWETSKREQKKRRTGLTCSMETKQSLLERSTILIFCFNYHFYYALFFWRVPSFLKVLTYVNLNNAAAIATGSSTNPQSFTVLVLQGQMIITVMKVDLAERTLLNVIVKTSILN